MLLSIIIPVHNGEKYIEKCINNLYHCFKSYLDKIEIIIVENGSTDNTTEVLEDCAKRYPFILTNSMKGVSNARNKGIELSSSKYIMFVDCDDNVCIDNPELFIEDLNKNKDLYIYNYIVSKNDRIVKRVNHSVSNDFAIEKLIVWAMEKPTKRCQAWAKVYRLDVIKKNSIYFDSKLSYAEDSEFVLRFLKKAKSYEAFSYTLYNYSLSSNSAMRSKNQNRIDEYHKSMMCSINEFKDDKYIKPLSKYLLFHLNIIMVHDMFVFGNKSLKDDVLLFKHVYDKSIYSNAIKHLKITDCLSKDLLPELFLKLNINIIAYLLCYTKSFLNQK